ncbi:helix-turn-helix domain-containing protein [Polaromonas sp. A23]|uniref:helix-turn-helix domain-containing protein n=1 Tax=Polaromonas sp. A23 TaxID=1944133 RepID=UPI000985B1B1|nr:XRE family transcriptional regulator [Polaromonas sp. A23]OOG36739.1 Cro/Cl family transcriptional regulator [Polaromonas sp. A23]
MPARSARAPAAAPEADRAQLGLQLREHRKARRLTLKDLSGRSGVALSTLSKMELGQISVSYEKLAAVARALALDVGQLFDARAAAPVGAKAPSVVWSSAGTAPAYSSGNYDYRMLATGFPGKRMTPLYGRIVARKRDQFPDFIRHQGQEFVMVLAGRVAIHFETGETIELGRHETAYFDSGVGHIYLSLGRGDGQVVVVMSE